MKLISHGVEPRLNQADFFIPFFRVAFRSFFWLGALFGSISITIWAWVFTGQMEFYPYGGGYFWHVHEMLFGFTVAIIVGFLLTAVQTWTGISSIKGAPLMWLVCIWVGARLLLAFNPTGLEKMIVVVDVLFLPLAGIALAVPIIKAKLWRNLFFVPILFSMALLNMLSHLAVMGRVNLSFISIAQMMVLLVTLVMCIMGGRVFPMFTANGTRTPKVDSILWIEKLSIGSVFLCVLLSLSTIDTPAWLDGGIYIVAGIINFVRAVRWRIWVSFKTPLVWSLHISYWAICFGLCMLGLVNLGLLQNPSSAYHAITVGGISLMILSMISRVSLGHTGRVIAGDIWMTLAFLCMGVSFIVRVFTPYLFVHYLGGIVLSATFWVIAFSLFLIRFAPVVFAARVDGAKG